MRRDISFYIEANIEQVYHAYLMAATNKPFERTCDEKPLHTISFGVNYSVKYNMNGGSCNIHFMPCHSGTAVIMRFSIAQAFGARYERYAGDLNNAMQKFLPVVPQPASYQMDDFLKPENQITPATLQHNAAPAIPTAPAVPEAPVASAAFCANCGNQLTSGARFCSRCGTPVSVPDKKLCPNCQTEARESDIFCTACGTRLK